MPVKAMDLFDAYQKSMLPSDQGFIVSSFFSPSSAYSRYEVVSYNNVKSIYPADNGLTFQTDGKKLHILIEPANYPKKAEEPYVRSSHEQIPHRFSELDLHTCKNQTKIYSSKEAIMSYTSFTVMKPAGVNFAFIFFNLPDVYDSMALFFEKTFNKEAGVPMVDAKKVAKGLGVKIQDALKWEYSS
ncbi:MAG TPA: hypothetical protein P5298_09705 [Spirochaetia bacterium]|nr:hypothetical protein [Spirochaetaceae bacterium]HPE89926.1 hypothetical protein [Spirochaetales bacterium]HRW24673.1 hypothetical protein [Spirochaetia bacterium]